MYYTIGDVSSDVSFNIIHHAGQFRHVKDGDVVVVFDHALTWDQDCVTEDMVHR